MQHRQIQTEPTTRNTQRGTSLIEVLVVMVILVIGILSIVRLFPAGFIALRNAENATFAGRLAQGALDALKKDNASLPDAIYMYSDADGFNPNFGPDDLQKTYTPSDGSDGSAYNDINKQRYISNETVSVPAPRLVNGATYPSLYVLSYGPIVLPDLATHADYLKVNSLPWTAQTGDSRTVDAVAGRDVDDPSTILQSGQQTFLVDYNAGKIAVPTASYVDAANASVPQTFVLVVQTQAGSFTLNLSVPSSSATKPYDGNWFDPTNTFVQSPPVPLPAAPWTSATLYRPFQYMGIYGQAMSKSFDTDPYEYAVYNGPNGASNVGTKSNMGVLAFNPLAASHNGNPPLKARVSYQVLNWHILHEDHDVPAGATSIHLALSHLKKISDVQFDQTTFGGLISDAATKSDIMMLDLDTGELTPLNTTNVQNSDDNSGAPVGYGIYTVSYQNGRVTFPDNLTKTTVRPEQHLRFFYEGDADWAVAVQKAPSYYTLVNTGNTAADTTMLKKPVAMPNEYVIDPSGTRVYFPICDSGKTVEFDAINYKVGGTPKSTIGEGTAAISTALDVTYGVPYVNLGSGGLNSSSILTDTPDSSTLAFGAVRGISARAVVIWRERNLWRSRSVDTLLTQTQ